MSKKVEVISASQFEIVDQENGTATIKTPQELIHIKHSITLRQYKYWLLMIKTYRLEAPDTINGAFLRIPKSQLTELFGYDLVTKELKDDLEALRIQPIIYNTLNKDGKKVQRGVGFISEWEVSPSAVGFKLPSFLHNIIKQLDLNNSMFQMLNWSIFNSFSGKYEAIIYKLCKDYIGVGQTPYLTLNEFRDYIGLEPNEYEEFKVFNRYILSGPIKRINECEISDIIIEVAFRKESRKVIGLQFKMSKKKQTMLDFGDNPAFFAAKTHISIEKQQKYLASYVADDISLSIERANIYAAELEKKGQQVDFGGLYHKAITENWGKEYAEKLRIAEETNQNKIKKVKSQQKIAIEESKKISDEIELKKQANELIEALSLEEKNAYFERYKLEANPLPLFIKSGTRSAAFKMWLGRELINQQS